MPPTPRRKVVLVQLPIPQPGMAPARGNVPLAAGYLKMFARGRGLEAAYDIEILPARDANTLGDQGLVAALLERDPWMVGFTCYLWNVERSLWVAEQMKARRPGVRVLVGGPEITKDNAWVLESPHVDFAALGEGEQTFVELLEALQEDLLPRRAVPGLWVGPQARGTVGLAKGSAGAGATASVSPLGSDTSLTPAFRTPLARLDTISSPYLEGILDAADEQMLLLETIRGCIFKCKFCFYPKSYDDLYFLSEEKIIANLRHAHERGAREVILLDPTLNQRKDFPGFLRLLSTCNPEHRFTYFGELRAEGIDTDIAKLLRDANFTEVEIGLQSTDPEAQKLMDRRNNMRAFEKGVRALLDAGIRVKIDLIVGLPGDTPDTVRTGIEYVRSSGLYSDVQVFNLAVLPGTAFREEAKALGLEHQARPPYYVLRTPTIRLEDMYQLMDEAEEAFDTEFDALPVPGLVPAVVGEGLVSMWRVDLDAEPDAETQVLPVPSERAQAFMLCFRGRDLGASRETCTRLVAAILADNPYTTLQVVLEPTGDPTCVTPELVDAVLAACYANPTYLDRFYAVLPGVPKGSKRVVVVVPAGEREHVDEDWLDAITECAAILWTGDGVDPDALGEQEFVGTDAEFA